MSYGQEGHASLKRSADKTSVKVGSKDVVPREQCRLGIDKRQGKDKFSNVCRNVMELAGCNDGSAFT